MGKQAFLTALEQGIAAMRSGGKQVTLVHHNDADGLASARSDADSINPRRI